jgi:hypothetical protein
VAPKRESMKQMDNASDETDGRRNNRKPPEGNKKATKRMKLEAESSSLSDKIDDMVKSKESLVNKTFKAKMTMAEKKRRWCRPRRERCRRSLPWKKKAWQDGRTSTSTSALNIPLNSV